MKYTAILKLKKMLDEANIPYQSFTDDHLGMKDFITENPLYADMYPMYALRLNDKIDVIQGYSTYGGRQDLLEIMGAMTVEEIEHDSVVGWLTAEEVFKRFKYCYENNTDIYKEN